MLRVFGGRGKGHGATRSLNALDELQQIEDAMAAVTHIMNDDVDAAEEHLSKGSSPFHQLGKGVVTFMRATLGFEQEIMREASGTLSEAENSAYEQQRRAHRNSSAYQSPIYPAGTEYAVCLAEAQLMSAIVGVLHESLTEAIKGFYKLRKAYLTLESVLEAEKKYLNERSTSSLGSTSSGSVSRPDSRTFGMGSSTSLAKESAVAPKTSLDTGTVTLVEPEASKDSGKEKEVANNDDDEDDDLDFVDADESHEDIPTPQEYMGHLGIPADDGAMVSLDDSGKKAGVKSSSAPDLPSADVKEASDPIEEFAELTVSETVKPGSDVSLFGDHPVDVFIISGSNFCFGILSLLISLVPPAFSTLLKIVGFKGDKERGIQMLWQATKFHNIHGAMGGLVLFGYYNGITAFCDIIPQSGEGSYPRARCKTLLADMRERYPKSHLWLLEEARMLASEKRLEEAVDYMASCSESPLKQLEALQWFERSLNTMYLHRYADTSAAFQKCVTLNNWSHGLYYYICGACHVELYRRARHDPVAAAKEAQKVKHFFDKVAPNTGRKKFMARQLPFDIFVNRKLQKWEQRAKDWGVAFIDAIGVSPIEEIIYFWNGYKRMRPEHLEVSLQNLAWSQDPSVNPHWEKEALDERGILSLLRAAVLRNMGRTEESMTVLEGDILGNDRLAYKGHLKDNWPAPCARYEMAANLWREADKEGRPEEHPDLLEQCKGYLVEVSAWESYDLDARIGMKVTTGKGTLRRYGIEC